MYQIKYTITWLIAFTMFLPTQSLAHCCFPIKFEKYDKSSEVFEKACTITKPQEISKIALHRSLTLFKLYDGNYIASHESIGCLGPVDLGKNLTSSEEFLPEADDWVLHIFEENDEPRSSITYGKNILQYRIRKKK